MELPLIHTCSVCDKSFDSEESYNTHTCITGFTPQDPQHLIVSTTPNFEEVAKAAQDRGSQAQEQQTVTPAEEVKPATE